jgi:hypothetical protein
MREKVSVNEHCCDSFLHGSCQVLDQTGLHQFLRALNFCMLLPDGGLDLFALLSAGVSLALLQKFHLPVHFLVSLGAASGVIWRLFG